MIRGQSPDGRRSAEEPAQNRSRRRDHLYGPDKPLEVMVDGKVYHQVLAVPECARAFQVAVITTGKLPEGLCQLRDRIEATYDVYFSSDDEDFEDEKA